ncbi:MAG TPA: hypothetical protein VLG50_06640 [Candidatus Saccharimonadales bacterium]|nr:hypothetical protein [Candidatus Saccharimonadales bacterium]
MFDVNIRNMIYILIVIVYFIILSLSIYILVNGFICDDHTCHTFTNALSNNNNKAIIIHLLDRLCEESMWPIAFIASSIIMFLLMAVLPLPLCMTYFIIVFLFSFIVFYCIIAFIIYHYVIPIKQYIKQYINKNN